MKHNKQQRKVLVTGGAGFIGSALVRMLVQQHNAIVVNVDALSYAGGLSALEGRNATEKSRHHFYHLDIGDAQALKDVFLKEKPDAVMHLAAETHVDRSIDTPVLAVQTNVMGTLGVLEAARLYWQNLSEEEQGRFRFLHVSTDEVYGDIGLNAPPSKEGDAYAPSSPYSASKAGADHLVRAWHHTYGLPVLLTHCCNNYGMFQHPEKLIPHMILKALSGKPLPVYGDGLQEREWIFVDDHVKALWHVLHQGEVGQSYHIGTGERMSNIQLVRLLCSELEKVQPAFRHGLQPYDALIEYVIDRPGHDRRYGLATDKIRALGWQPEITLAQGLAKTVDWYVSNKPWWEDLLSKGDALERQGLV